MKIHRWIWGAAAATVLVALSVAVVLSAGPNRTDHNGKSRSSNGHAASHLAEFSTSASASPSERVTSVSTLRNGQLTIGPAPASSVPNVSQAEAVSAAQKTGIPDAMAGNIQEPTSALYGDLTDTTYGTSDGNGTIVPRFQNYPVWIVQYVGVAVPNLGPGNGSSYSGTLDLFIDAASGSYLFATDDSGS